ncbi:hypothetical protein [Streptomyces luteogriseus]|uniref:hypothetical protein n=1 Tax=Streptomyces luteogriseus TaxID=68233 RepID=UPI00379B4932
MSDNLDAAMRGAIERAVRSPLGYFDETDEDTLHALVEAGYARRDPEEDAYSLTEKGWEESKLPSQTTPEGVGYTVGEAAMWQVPITLQTAVPDTSNPNSPTFGTVRPNAVSLGIFRNRAGVWCTTNANVFGPKVKDGKVTTKRDYTVIFTDPMDVHSKAPDWLRGIIKQWEDRANGLAQERTFDELLEASSLGAPHVKAATEEIPDGVKERLRKATQHKATDYLLGDFNTALRRLLIRENLAGTEWAIGKIREEAARVEGEEGEGPLSEFLDAFAEKLTQGLDKRTVELVTRED